jgi:hypothetical protein
MNHVAPSISAARKRQRTTSIEETGSTVGMAAGVQRARGISFGGGLVMHALNASSRSLLIAALSALALTAPSAARVKPAVNTNGRGELAVAGYDVVAYTSGVAAEGTAAFEHRWKGAIWRFTSAANRERFALDPKRYAPQFGGYCAWAVSRGYTADVDPEAFRISDGGLFLNYSKAVQRRWEQDIPGNVAKGRANWPAVLAK